MALVSTSSNDYRFFLIRFVCHWLTLDLYVRQALQLQEEISLTVDLYDYSDHYSVSPNP